MPGYARVAGEFTGKVTFVAVDIGPYVGLGSHDDAVRLLRSTGTAYPAAYAVDDSPLRRYDILGTPGMVVFQGDGRLIGRSPGALSEQSVRALAARLAGG